MCVYLCMYVCMYMCICVCICVHVYVHVSVFMCVCVCACWHLLLLCTKSDPVVGDRPPGLLHRRENILSLMGLGRGPRTKPKQTRGTKTDAFPFSSVFLVFKKKPQYRNLLPPG